MKSLPFLLILALGVIWVGMSSAAGTLGARPLPQSIRAVKSVDPCVPAVRLVSKNPFTEGSPAYVLSPYQEPFDFSAPGTESMLMLVNGRTAVIDFKDSEFSDSSRGLASEVASIINFDLTQAGLGGDATATAVSGSVKIETTKKGTNAWLEFWNMSGLPTLIVGLPSVRITGVEWGAFVQTELNDLISNKRPYVYGDSIHIYGTSQRGIPFSGVFIYGYHGTLLMELVDFMNNWILFDSTASITPQGEFFVVGHLMGLDELCVQIEDLPWNAGGTRWTKHRFIPF